jgi:hypothetical protein
MNEIQFAFGMKLIETIEISESFSGDLLPSMVEVILNKQMI